MIGDDNDSILLSFLFILNKKFLIPQDAKRKSRGSSASSLNSKKRLCSDDNITTQSASTLVNRTTQSMAKRRTHATVTVINQTDNDAPLTKRDIAAIIEIEAFSNTSKLRQFEHHYHPSTTRELHVASPVTSLQANSHNGLCNRTVLSLNLARQIGQLD